MTNDEALALAQQVLANKTDSHVRAASQLAAIVIDWKRRLEVAVELHNSVTSLQEACTKLKLEVRGLRNDMESALMWKNLVVYLVDKMGAGKPDKQFDRDDHYRELHRRLGDISAQVHKLAQARAAYLQSPTGERARDLAHTIDDVCRFDGHFEALQIAFPL